MRDRAASVECSLPVSSSFWLRGGLGRPFPSVGSPLALSHRSHLLCLFSDPRKKEVNCLPRPIMLASLTAGQPPQGGSARTTRGGSRDAAPTYSSPSVFFVSSPPHPPQSMVMKFAQEELAGAPLRSVASDVGLYGKVDPAAPPPSREQREEQVRGRARSLGWTWGRREWTPRRHRLCKKKTRGRVCTGE